MCDTLIYLGKIIYFTWFKLCLSLRQQLQTNNNTPISTRCDVSDTDRVNGCYWNIPYDLDLALFTDDWSLHQTRKFNWLVLGSSTRISLYLCTEDWSSRLLGFHITSTSATGINIVSLTSCSPQKKIDQLLYYRLKRSAIVASLGACLVACTS